jgi:hypothetical protein
MSSTISCPSGSTSRTTGVTPYSSGNGSAASYTTYYVICVRN